MYWNEMRFSIDFAHCNRRLMMQRIEEVIADALPCIEFEPMINIAQNYAAFEHHYGEDVIVHRKGATLAREGIVGIIPGSQGTASYIVEGMNNPESFCSCKDIDTVIKNELDLVKIKTRLLPIAVIKG